MQHKPLIASEAGISILSLNDISNAVSATFGTAGLILAETDLAPEFFDLKTGLAGELFQKFANYQLRLAIVVPNPERYGDRFNELAREHQIHNHIRIVRSKDEAEEWMQPASTLPDYGLPPMYLHNLTQPLIHEALAERIALIVLDGRYPKELFVAKPGASVEDRGDVWMITVDNSLPLEAGTIRPFHLRVVIRKSNGEITGMG